MKTKLNFLFISVLLISSLMLLFVGCDKDDSGPSVIGKWYFYQEEYSSSYIQKENGTSTYDPNYDYDFFNASLIEITENTVNFCENDAGTEYYCSEVNYEMDGNTLILTYANDLMKIEEEKDTMHYSFQDDMLVLTRTHYYSEGTEEITIYLKRYSGTIPPASWTTELSNDNFEPDDTYQDATSIQVGSESDIHVIVSEDSDWFKFNATAGENYLIQVLGYFDSYLELYGTDGQTLLDEDDDNNNNIDVTFNYGTAAVLLWNCTDSGMYYFKVRGYSTNSEGYYRVKVSTSDLTPRKKDSLSKDKKEEKISLFR